VRGEESLGLHMQVVKKMAIQIQGRGEEGRGDRTRFAPIGTLNVVLFLAVNTTNFQTNKFNITVLTLFFLASATCFDPCSDHHQTIKEEEL
jgi:hypothetical protein